MIGDVGVISAIGTITAQSSTIGVVTPGKIAVKGPFGLAGKQGNPPLMSLRDAYPCTEVQEMLTIDLTYSLAICIACRMLGKQLCWYVPLQS